MDQQAVEVLRLEEQVEKLVELIFQDIINECSNIGEIQESVQNALEMIEHFLFENIEKYENEK